MNTEQKICQNCKSDFSIEPEDFSFYEKIAVPAPTFCPDCRLQRRMALMNERSMYKTTCMNCGKSVLSIMNPQMLYTIYCPTCWWGAWDPLSYGRPVDFSKPFFQQIDELWRAVPWPSRFTIEHTVENSDYCNICSQLKNCYLLFNSDYDENCGYSTFLERSKESFDILMGDYCEMCYESSNIFKCYKVFFSSNCNDCTEVWFSRNLRNCSNCFGCVNLRNKEFYIFNNPYSKEEYEKRIAAFNLQSWNHVQDIQQQARAFRVAFPRKYAEGLNNVDVSGDYVFNSKNTHKSYEVGGCEDVKFSQFLFITPTKDSYDMTMWGGGANWMYECMGAGGGQNSVKFCFDAWSPSMNLEYCVRTLQSTSNLFGCAGVQGSYCILNKQYTKEEYEELVPRIKKHMNAMPYVDKKERGYKYGEFYPVEISPFAYNETLAHDYFPLTKEEAQQKGFRWKDQEEKNVAITMSQSQIPDSISETDDSITKEIIECAHQGTCTERCTQAFKVVAAELEFYRRAKLPLPRLCPNCRHSQRIRQKNPLQFWRGTCQCSGKSSANGVYTNVSSHFHAASACPNKFETSYSPERKEIVYCERCYQEEVT